MKGAKICSGDFCAELLPPESVFLVKGWSRAVCAVALLRHAYEVPEVLEAGWQPQK